MKKRPGAPIRPLIALGGEAEDDPDDALLPDLEATVKGAYEPQFDAHALLAGSTSSLDQTVEVSVDVDDEEVELVAQALLREYLNRRKLHDILKAFDEVCPRDEKTIHSRAMLRNKMGLGEPSKNYTVLEQVIAQRLADTKKGCPAILGDAPQRSRPKPVGRLEDNTFSIGEFTVGQSGAKNCKGIPPPRRICDMKVNKVIDHLSDIDLEGKTLLGRGAGGGVYRMKHKPTGTNIAGKYINLNNQQPESIHQELATLFNNQCPYIVDFHGSFFDPSSGKILIAMECMAGSLADTLNYGRLGEEEVRAITFQALQALVYLHSRKVIHRDIKPHNLLFDREGHVKISDFGISSSPVVTCEDFTATTFVGTLLYMSPERCKADTYSFSSDVWSMGVSIYQLLTGEPPYPSKDQAIFKIIDDDPPTLPASLDVSDECRNFCRLCCNKEPSDRPSCRELLVHPWFRTVTETTARQVFKRWVEEHIPCETQPVTTPQDADFGEIDNVIGL